MLRPGLGAMFVAALLAAGCQDEPVQQHGLEFRSVRQGALELWLVDLKNGEHSATVPFHYLPDSTLDVTLPEGLAASMRASGPQLQQLWVSADPAGEHYSLVAAAEIISVVEELGLLGGPPVRSAFTLPNERPEPLPVVGCQQASPEVGVIMVQQGSVNQILRDGHCIRATYRVPQDALRVAERLCYGLLGVVE